MIGFILSHSVIIDTSVCNSFSQKKECKCQKFLQAQLKMSEQSIGLPIK